MLYFNYQLQPFNTFNVKALARYFIDVHSIDQLQSIIAVPTYQQLPKLILGGGSNVLFTADYPGLVIKNTIRGITCIQENKEHVWLKVGAGESWHEFVLYCLAHQYAGVENLSLIPGTVGAAPVQNIGAYGVELESLVDSLNAIHLTTQKQRCFSKKECAFGYRDSIFKKDCAQQYVITDVTFKLSKAPHINISYGGIQQRLHEQGILHPSIVDVSNAVIHIRQQKLPDPKTHPNAGSFFKNPIISADLFGTLKQVFPTLPGFAEQDGRVKVPAAWLIEACGLRGITREGVGVSPHHALVIINHGNPSGVAICALASHIQEVVQAKFNIVLQFEVNTP